MPQLMIVVASTRPDRVGLPVSRWVAEQVLAHGHFDLDVADLAELDLPMMNEAAHPRLQKYEHDHTKRWSARVEAADAFIFVHPEYNHGYTAPLKNAIDYLFKEWGYKPVGFVSYGGISGGIRAVQQLKPVVSVLKMFPVTEAVPIPWVTKLLDDTGAIVPTDFMNQSAKAMLEELARVEEALRPLRRN